MYFYDTSVHMGEIHNLYSLHNVYSRISTVVRVFTKPVHSLSQAKQQQLIENYEAVNDTLQMAKDLIMDTENTVAEMHLLVQVRPVLGLYTLRKKASKRVLRLSP